VEDNETGKTILNHHLRRNRERFSTLHTAREPNKVEEVELESEDLQGMIRQPPKVGAIQFHHEPESTNTSQARVTARDIMLFIGKPIGRSIMISSVTATTFQGTTSVLTSRGPY